MDKRKAWIIDIETYPNCFLFAVLRADESFKKVFEVSDRVNEIDRVFACMDYLHKNNEYMISFNGINFDYPILHRLHTDRKKLPVSGKSIAMRVYRHAQEQIDSFKDDGFGNTVKSSECYFKHIDLYRVWHFNNKARATGLKMLEFNMRMNNIEDLPFAVGQTLSHEEIDKLKAYNIHDVTATLNFFNASQEQIDFRLALSDKYNKDWTNCDDTKIGAEYFTMSLENAGVKLKEYRNGKLVMKQTKRDKIKISDCLFDYYDFKRPEFIAVMKWFSEQVITETKGVFSDVEEHDLGDLAKYSELIVKRKRFKGKPTDEDILEFKNEHPLGWVDEEELKATEYAFDENGEHIMEYHLDEDGSPNLSKKQKKKRIPKKSYWMNWRIAETLNVVIDGFRFDFGTGGIHGSIESKIAKETKKYQLIDADVSSMYPNLAISNRIYPDHLGETFCDIYQDMYEQRKSYPKGSAENAMLKLALNGTYGKSNDKYSIFYDPKFTMSITVNGQLSLCLLAEKLLNIPDLRIIQVNTDGITVALPRAYKDEYDMICNNWQDQVKLQLEFADYSKMIIRDVNNYIALYTNGKVKRKGAYQYEDLGWHQNQSALVIPMAAEAQMVFGKPIEEFITEHMKDPDNKWDFMLRTKVPRSSKLVMLLDDNTEVQLQNICRYVPSLSGGKLIKIMPPLEGEIEDRRLSIDKEYKVLPCNNANDFDFGVLDMSYYVNEAKKLLVGVDNPCNLSDNTTNENEGEDDAT